MSEKAFILYDGRARCGNTHGAAVLTTATSEAQCRKEGGNYGSDAIWFEYDKFPDPDRPDGKHVLISTERMREDLSINPKYPSAKQRGRQAR